MNPDLVLYYLGVFALLAAFMIGIPVFAMR